MKRILYRRPGPPEEVLEVHTEPSVSLQSGEVRVRVLAAPIHPSDLLQVAGSYGITPELPATPGSEGCGEVVEVASDVTDLQVGQQVLLTAGGGTWRDEVRGPAAAFIPVPSGNPEQMAMLVVNPLTAQLLLSEADLDAGDWLIQSAANSSVGETLIQLAARRGIRTVNVVRRESLIPDLEALGADVVLTDGDKLAERVHEATGGATITHAIDAVGADTFSRLAQVLANGSTLTSYGVMAGKYPVLDLRAVIFRDIHIRGFWLAHWFKTATGKERQTAFGTLIPLVASGQLRSRVDSRFPLERIEEAVTRAAEGGRNGKVLLTPSAA